MALFPILILIGLIIIYPIYRKDKRAEELLKISEIEKSSRENDFKRGALRQIIKERDEKYGYAKASLRSSLAKEYIKNSYIVNHKDKELESQVRMAQGWLNCYEEMYIRDGTFTIKEIHEIVARPYYFSLRNEDIDPKCSPYIPNRDGIPEMVNKIVEKKEADYQERLRDKINHPNKNQWWSP